jgi:hypothetical protein
MFTENQCCGSVNPNYGSGSYLHIFTAFLNVKNQRYRDLLRLGLLFFSTDTCLKTKIVPYRTVPYYTGQCCGSGIRDEQPGSYFRELRNSFWVKIRIRDGKNSVPGITTPDPQYWYLQNVSHAKPRLVKKKFII